MPLNLSKQHIIERIDTLPTLPVVMMRILDCINDPHSSAEDLKNIIIKDPSTSSKVLSLANSAYYGYTKSIEDITRAIIVLGFDTIIDIALSVSLSSIINPPANSLDVPLEEMWKHSIAAGLACHLCAEKNIYPYKELAFLIGLIHDIGKIVNACFFPEEFNTVLKNTGNNEKYIFEEEKNVLGFTHNEAGKWLSAKWNLPPSISIPIQFHHDPQHAPEEFRKEAVLAHFADHIVRLSNIGASGDNNKLTVLSPLVNSHLKIDENEIESYVQELDNLIPKIQAFVDSIL
ncbi:HDOD domain-containing protein [candidate division KSB1 bacterium]